MEFNHKDASDTTEKSGSESPRYKLIAFCVVFLAIVLGIAWAVASHQVSARHFFIALGLLSVAGAIGSAIAYRYRTLEDGVGVIPATVTMNVVIFVCVGLVTVSIYTAAPPHNWTASMIWSLAAVLSGGAVGFLFGIPRSRTGKSTVAAIPASKPSALTPTANPLDDSQAASTATQPVPAAVTEQLVSTGSETAIEQISDWLTKIIVGVGLTNLKELPGQLNTLGKYVATSIDPAGPINIGLGLGIVIYFAVLGVITGYLLTQMFLLNLVNRQAS